MAKREKPRRTWRQHVTGWLLLIVIGYAMYAGALFVLQGRLIFPRHLVPDPGAPGVEVYGIEQIWLDIGGGERVEAWFLGARRLEGAADAPRPLVVMAHGNAELIDDHINRMLNYHDLGVNSLMVEYRGYGRSGGTPSQKAIVGDTAEVLAQVLERPGVDPSKVIYHGRSIGAGVLCALAEHPDAPEPAAMILESAFTSVPDMARRFAIPSFLIRNPFRNDRVVRGFGGPILLFHGTRDSIIPVSHGRRLAAIAGDNATLIEQDADHNNFPSDGRAFWREIEEWLGENGL